MFQESQDNKGGKGGDMESDESTASCLDARIICVPLESRQM